MSDEEEAMNDLPSLRRRSPEYTRKLAAQMLTAYGASESALLELLEIEHNAYRAVFATGYFVLAEGASEPSKSQWNTLKKRFKRAAPFVFIFREHGTILLDGRECYYLDFGFFADDRPQGR
jgi:hypothetical protein